MRSEAIIERVWKYTWWRRSSEIGDTHGGHDRVGLDKYLEAINGRRARC